MTFPLAQTVQHLPHVPGGGEDSHGNPIDTWGPSVDVAVYGWASPTSTEPKLAGHDRVVVDVEMFSPPTWPGHARDRVSIAKTVYEVLGEPEDYNHGPFGWQPGVVVNLRLVEDS